MPSRPRNALSLLVENLCGSSQCQFLKEPTHTHTHTYTNTQSIREGDSGNETQTFGNGSFVTRRSRRPPFVLRLFFLHFTRRLQFPSPFLNLFILVRCYETVPRCVFFFPAVPLCLPPHALPSLCQYSG